MMAATSSTAKDSDAQTLLRALSAVTRDAMLITDETGTPLWLSQAFCELSGYEASELLNGPQPRLWPARDDSLLPGERDSRLMTKAGASKAVRVQASQLQQGQQRLLVTWVHVLSEEAPHKTEGNHKAEGNHKTEGNYEALVLATERQAKELKLLDQIRLAIAHELDLGALHQKMVIAIQEIFVGTRVSLYLKDDSGFVLQHQVGYQALPGRLPLTQGVMGRVLHSKDAILLQTEHNGQAKGTINAKSIAKVAMPVFDEEQVVGVLNVESKNGAKLSQAEIKLIQSLSLHLGVAITRSRLYASALENERKYLSVIEKVREVFFHTDAEGYWTLLNPAWAEITGYSIEESFGRHVLDYVFFEDQEAVEALFAGLAAGETATVRQDVRFRAKRGELRWLEIQAYPIKSKEGVFIGFTGTLSDVTEKKRAKETLKRREAVLEAVSFAAERFLRSNDWKSDIHQVLERLGQASGVDAVSIFKNSQDASGLGTSRLHTWQAESRPAHPAHEGLTFSLAKNGFGRWEELMREGQSIHGPIFTLPYSEQAPLYRQGVQAVAAVPVTVSQEWWGFIRFDNHVSRREWTSSELSALRAAADILGAAIEQQMLNEQLIHQVEHDTLTGLPNRLMMKSRLENLLAIAKRHKHPLSLMLLDLDNFKLVNDSLGHVAGDALLVAVGQRLLSCLRTTDTVARLGGDEFILILPMTRGKEAAGVAQKVLDALSAPFMIEGQELYITPSIGISVCPTDGKDGDTLLKSADAAMYGAKRMGKNTYQFYAAAMNAEASTRLSLETEFRKAMQRDQFRLYFQPRVDLNTGKIVNVEALLRWQHPKLGLVFPQEFIPLAEQIGLIQDLGHWVLYETCQQVRRWRDEGFCDISASVNLSSYQFRSKTLVAGVTQVLKETGLPPDGLELEITENMLIQDVEQAVMQMRLLKEHHGLRLAIDDFGTGYSSLSYLLRFPVDTLKIDKSFVSIISESTVCDSSDLAIVKTIVSLGHNMNLKVVAEGVETEHQLQLLRTLGCDEGQGYLFARALPIEEVSRLLGASGTAAAFLPVA